MGNMRGMRLAWGRPHAHAQRELAPYTPHSCKARTPHSSISYCVTLTLEGPTVQPSPQEVLLSGPHGSTSVSPIHSKVIPCNHHSRKSLCTSRSREPISPATWLLYDAAACGAGDTMSPGCTKYACLSGGGAPLRKICGAGMRICNPLQMLLQSWSYPERTQLKRAYVKWSKQHKEQCGRAERACHAMLAVMSLAMSQKGGCVHALVFTVAAGCTAAVRELGSEVPRLVTCACVCAIGIELTRTRALCARGLCNRVCAICDCHSAPQVTTLLPRQTIHCEASRASPPHPHTRPGGPS
eukprot:360766-Chlamydomonas_euryale.AAC.20